MYYTTFYGVESGNERVRDPLLRIAPVVLAAAIAAIGWVYQPAQIVNRPTSSGQNSFSQPSQPTAPSNQTTSNSNAASGTSTNTGGEAAGSGQTAPAVGGRGGVSPPVFNSGGSPTK